jgi:hypothetical protein
MSSILAPRCAEQLQPLRGLERRFLGKRRLLAIPLLLPDDFQHPQQRTDRSRQVVA